MILFKLHDAEKTEFGIDDDAQFSTDIVDYDGEEIYELIITTSGFYDITFGDGHVIYGVSTHNIEVS